MKNDAAPSYFNGGTLKDYEEYRYSQLVYYTVVMYYIYSNNCVLCSL